MNHERVFPAVPLSRTGLRFWVLGFRVTGALDHVVPT